MAENNGTTIIVMSGDMDRVMAAFNIAIGAAAMGKETNMFFTFWGLKAIQKGNFTGKSFLGRMMGLMNRGGINRIGPSQFNFWGLGPVDVQENDEEPSHYNRWKNCGKRQWTGSEIPSLPDEHGSDGNQGRRPDTRGGGSLRGGFHVGNGRPLEADTVYIKS